MDMYKAEKIARNLWQYHGRYQDFEGAMNVIKKIYDDDDITKIVWQLGNVAWDASLRLLDTVDSVIDKRSVKKRIIIFCLEDSLFKYLCERRK